DPVGQAVVAEAGTDGVGAGAVAGDQLRCQQHEGLLAAAGAAAVGYTIAILVAPAVGEPEGPLLPELEPSVLEAGGDVVVPRGHGDVFGGVAIAIGVDALGHGGHLDRHRPRHRGAVQLADAV